MPTTNPVDAISNDVSDLEENRQLTPREIAMEAISKKHITNLEAELGISLTSAEPDAQIADQLAEPAPVVPEPVAPATPVVPTFKVKVEGVEQEVDADTLVRAYQKNSAADRRLEQATALLREAEEQARKLTEAPTQTPAPAGKTPEELRAEAANLLDKMFDGDKDAAADALVGMLANARGGDQPTPAPVQAPIDESALAARVIEQMAVTSAFNQIKTDYPDVIADPDLEELTAMKIKRAVAQGTPHATAMVEAAAEVYKIVGKTPAGRQPDPEPTPANTRLANKERLDNLPIASATAASAAPPDEVKNPSAVIAELASRRLGQSLPRPAS